MNKLTTNNTIIDLIIGVIITTMISYIFNNLSNYDNIINYIKKAIGKNETNITIEYYATLTDGFWAANDDIIKNNIILIKSIFTYCSKNKLFEIDNSKLFLGEIPLNEYTYKKDYYNAEIIIKPVDKKKLKEPYNDIEIELKESTSVDGTVCKREICLKLESKYGNKRIMDFIRLCYNEYIINIYKEKKDNNIKYFLNIFQKENQLMCEKIEITPTKTFEYIYFKEKEKLIKTIDKVINKQISKFTLLLYGPPGTGKTSIIKAISNYTNRHIQYIKLSNIKTFNQAINIFFKDTYTIEEGSNITTDKIPINKKIFILEDIDVENNIVHNRNNKIKNKKANNDSDIDDNKKESSNLNLSDILQIFDGIIEVSEIITIITTNNIEKLDKALIRPGRITMSIYLGYMEIENILELLSNYYKIKIDELKINEQLLNNLNKQKWYPCEIENICIQNETIDDFIMSII